MSSQFLYRRDLIDNAKSLRSKQTLPEQLLWRKIRNRQLNDCKFRRQFPVLNFILDFYCHEKKLAIELDGNQHKRKKDTKYDLYRTKKLNELGIKVIRFWDYEVIQNLTGVLEEIIKLLNS